MIHRLWHHLQEHDDDDDDDDGNNDNNDDDDILTCACSPARADARKPAPDVFASSDDYYGQNQ